MNRGREYDYIIKACLNTNWMFVHFMLLDFVYDAFVSWSCIMFMEEEEEKKTHHSTKIQIASTRFGRCGSCVYVCLFSCRGARTHVHMPYVQVFSFAANAIYFHFEPRCYSCIIFCVRCVCVCLPIFAGMLLFRMHAFVLHCADHEPEILHIPDLRFKYWRFLLLFQFIRLTSSPFLLCSFLSLSLFFSKSQTKTRLFGPLFLIFPPNH